MRYYPLPSYQDIITFFFLLKQFSFTVKIGGITIIKSTLTRIYVYSLTHKVLFPNFYQLISIFYALYAPVFKSHLFVLNILNQQLTVYHLKRSLLLHQVTLF